LEEAAARLRESNPSGLLNVAVESAFAAKWLLGRLHRFNEKRPAWEVRLNASQALVDLNRVDLDLATRYGAGRYPGMVSEKLFAEVVFPVCAPELVHGERALLTPGDLKHHTLLHKEWAFRVKTLGRIGEPGANPPVFTGWMPDVDCVSMNPPWQLNRP